MTEDVKFNEYPPALLPAIGKTITGVFTRILLGPEYDFGQGPVKPLIAVIELTSGVLLTDRKPGALEYDGDPGKEYALWLIHGVLLDRMKELRPVAGERIAVRYDGEKLKKNMTAEDKNATYNSWQVVMLDRPSEIVEATWDD